MPSYSMNDFPGTKPVCSCYFYRCPTFSKIVTKDTDKQEIMAYLKEEKKLSQPIPEEAQALIRFTQ